MQFSSIIIILIFIFTFIENLVLYSLCIVLFGIIIFQQLRVLYFIIFGIFKDIKLK